MNEELKYVVIADGVGLGVTVVVEVGLDVGVGVGVGRSCWGGCCGWCGRGGTSRSWCRCMGRAGCGCWSWCRIISLPRVVIVRSGG